MKRWYAAGVWSVLPVTAALACDVRIESGWIRQPVVATATTVAAYGTLVNTGTKPVTLIGASSNASGSATLHQSMMHGTTAMMRPLEKLVVPAGGRVELMPGGMHLMLEQPRFAAKPGDRITITLQEAGGCVVTGEFVVRSVSGMATGAPPAHHH